MINYDFYEHRKYGILILISLVFLFIIIKLFSVQIINTTYKISAENNIIRKIIKYPERGWIYDRNKYLLVSNKRVHDIMVVPYQMEKKHCFSRCDTPRERTARVVKITKAPRSGLKKIAFLRVLN